MKKYLFILFSLLVMTACEKTPKERAEILVREYLEQTADDPSSIEIVSLSDFIIMDSKTKSGGTVPAKYINVTYRSKNAYGALVKHNAAVRFDDDVTVIRCFDCFAQ